MKRIITFAIVALAMVGFISCSDNEEEGSKATKIELTPNEMAVNEATATFTDKLLRIIISNEYDQNIIISPFSLQMSLAMMANGADEQTAQEIKNAIGFNGMSQENINSYYKTMLKALWHADDKADIKQGNSVWLNAGMEYNNDFADICSNDYLADMMTTNEGDDIDKLVSSWVDSKTNGKIREALGNNTDPWSAYLMNTLYFKAEWADGCGFTKGGEKGTFCNYDESASMVDGMYAALKQARTYSCRNYEAVSIAYGNGTFSFDVLYDRNGRRLDWAIEELSVKGIPDFAGFDIKKNFEISMPLFDIEATCDLSELCRQLGINSIFQEENSGMANMANKDAHISGLTQACRLAVDEKGKVNVIKKSDGPVSFIDTVSHVWGPFLFFIRENSTGAILLMGKIMSM